MSNNQRTDSNKVPRWFWIVSSVALVWNLLGVMAFFNQTGMDTSALESAQRDFYESIPGWATAAFGVAVFGGVLGCVALLLRKRVATLLLYASLAGVLVQVFHSLVLAESLAIFGPAGIVLPSLTIGIGIALIVLSRHADKSGWLR